MSNKRVLKIKKRYSVSFSDKLGFKVPSIDFPMYMLLQKKLGSSASKTNINEAEKVLYKSQQSLLPMFPVLAYLEHQNLPGAQGKAVKDLANLAGRAFYDMSDMRRRNVLEIVGPNVVSLVDDRDKFKIEEDKELFGTSVVKKLRKDGQFLSDINSLDLGKSKSRSVKDRLAPPPSSPGDSRRRQYNNYGNNATNQLGYHRYDQGGSGGAQQQGASIQPNQAGSFDFRRNNGGPPTNPNDAGPSNGGWFNRGYVNHSLYRLDPYRVSPVFIGGRIRHYWRAWRLISADPWILGVVQEGFRLEFESSPVAWIVPRNAGMSEAQLSIGRQEVKDLFKKGAIIEPSRVEFVSPMFIIPKATGGFRPIINLKRLNQFLILRHFKMENINSLRHLIVKGDWMVKLDLKDAYLTVPVFEGHQKYLQFLWEGKVYQFVCLPFGLASAPWAFTKFLKPVVAFLRSLGCRLVIYLDDLILLDQCKIRLMQTLSFVKHLLQVLGFIINDLKSSQSPLQFLEFLGLLVDSVNLKIFLPEDKIESIRTKCSEALAKSYLSLRDLASLLGRFNWAESAVPLARAHYRAVQAVYIGHSRLFGGDLRAKTPLSRLSRMDLAWWMDRSVYVPGRNMFEAEPALTICADASLTGWGAVCGETSTGMTWTSEESSLHINVLELQAAFNALQSFAGFESNCTIRLRLDNSTAVSYINRVGGTRSHALNELAIKIARWCESKNISLQAEHLPGVLNVIADRESRRRIDWSDWRLNPEAFRSLMEVWPMRVDLFSNPWNAQLDTFVSWNAQPGAWATNAFSLNWRSMKGYAFPPFSVIRDCLSKIRRERASIVVVTPLWTSQPWFPSLLGLSCDVPRIFRPSEILLVSAQGERNPLCEVASFRLVAWMLSGEDLKGRDFRARWSTYSWQRHETTQTPLTLQPGEFGQIGVWEGVPIPCVMM